MIAASTRDRERCTKSVICDLSSNEHVQQLRAAIRNVPDFPSPGIQFKDITPILGDRVLLKRSIEALAEPYLHAGITKVVGVEARGFILGSALARRLDAGFVPVRKKGKLPHTTYMAVYELEYGTDSVEMHVDALNATDRVLIHDDVMATGGTAAATNELIELAGAGLVGFSFLVELSFLDGRERLDSGLRVHSVLQF